MTGRKFTQQRKIKLFLFSYSRNLKGRISQSVEYREPSFGLESFASAAWYQHSTYRHTWVSTHKEHSQTQETQIRKHSNANRHTHTNPCSPEQTHSQVSVHTQQCTFCPSIGLSITNYDSRVLILPLPPPHPTRNNHIADVSLPINAHRAALQWSWRVPQQQSTVQSLQTCMYVPAEQSAEGEEGRRGTESKGKWAENMSSQAGRTAVCVTEKHAAT